MFILTHSLFCVLISFIHYRYVAGEDDKFRRFIVGEDYKPAIFGSYGYDPIKEQFEITEHPNDSSQIINSSFVLSTVIGEDHPEPTTVRLIRSNVNNIIDPKAVTAWWARKITKNDTKTFL